MEKFTLYYASDIHGSELLWRKFINAGRFYGAHVLVMGGDLTGKGIVPIIPDGRGRWQATFLGRRVVARNERKLAELEDDILFNGMYPYRCDAEQAHAIAANEKRQEQLFEELAAATVERWLRLAEERLPDDGGLCFVMPGNDDVWSIDAAFEISRRVQNCDQAVIDLGDGYSLLSLGYANRTPWDSPRELDEHELGAMIDALAQRVPDMARAIFNLHVPPYGSELDVAPELDEDFTPVFKGGKPVLIPVGSTAVRAAIERYQPLLGIHGHIHESKAMARIGRTVCINPGSSYSTGQIDGALIQIEGSRVAHVQFTCG
jgi:Icc-related predicted phosphoesterase